MVSTVPTITKKAPTAAHAESQRLNQKLFSGANHLTQLLQAGSSLYLLWKIIPPSVGVRKIEHQTEAKWTSQETLKGGVGLTSFGEQIRARSGCPFSI